MNLDNCALTASINNKKSMTFLDFKEHLSLINLFDNRPLNSIPH